MEIKVEVEETDEDSGLNENGPGTDFTGLISQREQSSSTTSSMDEMQNYVVYCFKIFFMAFYAILFPFHLFCLGISVVFDTVCLVKERTSLVNCSEKVILARPQPLVLLGWLTTLLNTAVVLITLNLKPVGIEFCGFRTAFRRLVKKGSFWSFNINFVFSILQYIIVIFQHLIPLNAALAVTMVCFSASRLVVAYSVNYLQPVRFPNVGERNMVRLYTWLAYWVILVMFFLDTTHAALAVTLDVAEKVTPLGNVNLGLLCSYSFWLGRGIGETGAELRLVLLGFKATYEVRLFMFYWNKLFHGDKDLFSTALMLRSIESLPHRNIQRSHGENVNILHT